MFPITALSLPHLNESPDKPDPREPEERFAARLGAALSCPVPLQVSSVVTAPTDSLLIAMECFFEQDLENCTPEQGRQIGRRMVLMEARFGGVHRLLSRWPLAAAVDEQDFFGWRHHPEIRRGARFWGRIAAAERAGIPFETHERFGNMGYALLSRRGDGIDLPELLAEYLTAYTALGLHHTP